MPDPDIVGPRVVIRNLTRRFRSRRGDYVALDNVSLEIGAGEALVLLGPSGCGKTTLLRCVAGLERPDAGEISVHGDTVFSADKRINLPPEKRRLAMVFQSYALWPHMTAFENVAYPLRNLRVPRDEIEQRVRRVLEMVGLEKLGGSFPGQLSGGQQQRVALARAVVGGEGLVLFDEPLSNLDAKVRERLRIELLSMQRDIGFSSLYVTHDQTEALALADRVAVMDVGRIVQIGQGNDVYQRPASRYVANFVGRSNELPGTVRECRDGVAVVDTAIGPIQGQAEGLVPGASVFVMFRPESLSPRDGPNRFTAKLKHAMALGNQMEWLLAVGDTLLLMTLDDREPPAEGSELTLSVDPGRIRIYPGDPA